MSSTISCPAATLCTLWCPWQLPFLLNWSRSTWWWAHWAALTSCSTWLPSITWYCSTTFSSSRLFPISLALSSTTWLTCFSGEALFKVFLTNSNGSRTMLTSIFRLSQYSKKCCRQLMAKIGLALLICHQIIFPTTSNHLLCYLCL